MGGGVVAASLGAGAVNMVFVLAAIGFKNAIFLNLRMTLFWIFIYCHPPPRALYNWMLA